MQPEVSKKFNLRSCEFACVEGPLRLCFYHYAKLVARHPWPFVIIPVIFTIICAFGFSFKEKEVDAVYLYTPTDAPSKTEKITVTSMFPLTDGNFQPEKVVTDEKRCTVIVSAEDGGSILRRDYRLAVEELNNDILSKINIFSEGTEYSFQDLCMLTSNGECWKNPTITFVNGLVGNKFWAKNLTYPRIYFGRRNFYIASTLAGITFKNGTNQIEEAKAWQLIYQLRYDQNSSKLSTMWEHEFLEFMGNYKNPWLNIAYIHSQTLNEELVKNADKISPKFAITFMVLVGFALMSTVSLISFCPFRVDWVVSKPMLSLFGVFNAGMGVVAGIGFLSYFRYPYNDIVSVTPFLIVSICAEYMFLMTGAWRRTNRLESVEDRLAESVSIHAVSIVIAMGTGALAFAVGAITTIPAVQIFCVYCCVSMLFALLFQFTFFTGLLAIFGRLEAAGKHSLLFCIDTIPVQDADEARWYEHIWLLGSRPNHEQWDHPINYTTSWMDTFFEEWYAPALMAPVTKFCTIVVILLYLALGLWGCSHLKEGLKPVNLLVGDSYAVSYYQAMEKYLLPYGQEVQIVVADARSLNLTTHEGRNRAMQIVSAFANTEHTIGMDGTSFFLPEFMEFVREVRYDSVIELKSSAFYKLLKNDFITLNTYSDWAADLIWDTENPYQLNSFRFSVGMKNFVTSNDQVETMQLMRRIASKFPELKITTFMFLFMFADQYRLVLRNTIENIGIALALMLLVSVILIPHPLCSLCVALTIISIDIGVVGYMTLWDVNLDAISMITIIMSVGFSVDFTAHVSYGYVVLSHEEDPVKRMKTTLGARGWPVTQACTATILGILVLANMPAYMIITFFKTVFLVMSIGLVHAVVFLPVILDVLIRPVLSCTKRLQTDDETHTDLAIRNGSTRNGHSNSFSLDNSSELGGLRSRIKPISAKRDSADFRKVGEPKGLFAFWESQSGDANFYSSPIAVGGFDDSGTLNSPPFDVSSVHNGQSRHQTFEMPDVVPSVRDSRPDSPERRTESST